jgi:hypothetical protein
MTLVHNWLGKHLAGVAFNSEPVACSTEGSDASGVCAINNKILETAFVFTL